MQATPNQATKLASAPSKPSRMAAIAAPEPEELWLREIASLPASQTLYESGDSRVTGRGAHRPRI